MDFNNIKIDKSRSIQQCFDYFKDNTLDFHTAMNSINEGGFATLGNVSYGFTRETSIKWNSFLISILKKANLIDLISIKTIDKKMKELFQEYLIKSNLNLFNEFHQLILELKIYANQTNFFYFPIDGLICNEIYSFGNLTLGNFNKKTTTPSFSEKIKKNIKLVEKEHKKLGTFNPNDIFLLELKKTIRKYKNKLVIEVSNSGDPLIAKEKSKIEAEDLINQIIFISDISVPYRFNIKFSTYQNEQLIEPLCLNYDELSTSALNDEIIYNVAFDLSKKNEDQNKIGFTFIDLCFPLLSTDFKNDLLDKLRTAINWYSSSIKSTNINESFLFCAIGIESLLNSGRDAITKTLAENTAFLIAKNDIESRKQIYKTMIDLYSKRSGIAHGGNINIEIKDLKQIRYYLAMSIIKIILKIKDNQINSNDDLTNFLENQKFG
ncbi:hypothetical protein ACX1N5_05475 [Acinetobacter sp. ANC 4636]